MSLGDFHLPEGVVIFRGDFSELKPDRMASSSCPTVVWGHAHQVRGARRSLCTHSFYTSSVSPRINKKQGKAHKLLQDRSKLPFVNFTAFE